MLTIRSSRPDDFHDIIKLLRQLWPSLTLDEEAIKVVYMRSLDSDSDVLLSAEHNNEVVGFGAMVIKNSFWQSATVGYISTLVVEEELRNQGIGRTLLNEIMDLAKLRGCKKVELDSGFHREQAHAMYEHYGFKKRAYVFSKDV